jgi:hypothetical protein
MFTGAFDLDRITSTTMSNLGLTAHIIHERHLQELSSDLHHKAILMIRKSIDSGVPVIGHNLENYEYGLIYGYDDERSILQICDISSQDGKELPYNILGKRPLHGAPIPPELTLIALADREEQPHVQVEREAGRQDESYHRTLRTSLGFIIDHLNGCEQIVNGFVNGLAAFDVWIEAFHQGNVHAMGNAYNIMLFANARKFALRFFTDSAQPDFYWVHDTHLQQLMANAAAHYAVAYDGWIALRHRFPFAKAAESDTTSAEVVNRTVQDLRRIKDAESAGLERIQQMYEHLK